MNNRDEDKTQTHVVIAKGTMVSHYRIDEKIGAGGMGEVYLAEDTKLGRKVALKFLPIHLSDSQELRNRFLNEARAAAALDHPNICPVYEIDDSTKQPFMAMAYIDGQTVRERLSTGPMMISEVIRVGVDVAHGLTVAHEKKIIHRDIKSSNIILNEKGQAKITDFGLARLIDDTRITRTGVRMGTPAYMSPEQISGSEVDRRSDIWSLGVVLYEMVTGRLPFRGDSEQVVTHQITNEQVEPITAVRSGVPIDLDHIIDKCLAKEPSKRYQHADDLAVDLLNVRMDRVVRASKSKLDRLLLPLVVALVLIATYFAFKSTLLSQAPQGFDNPLGNATFRKLTDIEGSKDATISPDGKYVAFVSDQDGEFDIWVSQVETGQVYNRTRGQFGDMRRGLQDVGFSASSSEILSFSNSNKQPVLSMPLLDGPARKILRDSVIMVAWSPDGRQLTYYTDSEGDPVFVANADGTNYRAILSAEPGTHQHYQRWSPDGQWIYMVRGYDNVWDTDLWRVRPDGNNLEQLTYDQLDVSHPTPISERIVLFIARDEDGSGPWIWAIDVESKAVQKASIGAVMYNSLSTSTDGRRLATSAIKPEACLLDLWKVPILDTIARESDVVQIDVSGRRAQMPRFGNDGFYFMSEIGTGYELLRSHQGQVSDVWKGIRSPLYEIPAISHDGKTIALALKSEGKQYLHLIDADGSNLRILSNTIDVRGTCSFSPDNKWIATGGYDNTGIGLFVISVEGDTHKKIVQGEALHPVWSPTGDLIAYGGEQVSGFSNLKAVTPEGDSIEVPHIKLWESDERFRFLPDGSGIVYMEGWAAAQDFYLLDLAEMKSRRLTNLAKGASTRTFDISPDGKSIIFDRLRVKTEIYLIELPEKSQSD